MPRHLPAWLQLKTSYCRLYIAVCDTVKQDFPFRILNNTKLWRNWVAQPLKSTFQPHWLSPKERWNEYVWNQVCCSNNHKVFVQGWFHQPLIDNQPEAIVNTGWILLNLEHSFQAGTHICGTDATVPGAKRVLPLQARVDLGATAIKWWLHTTSKLLNRHLSNRCT